jgi:hypothetical protein
MKNSIRQSLVQISWCVFAAAKSFVATVVVHKDDLSSGKQAIIKNKSY